MSARRRGSNSLAVLAARINDEDAAVAADLQSAVAHAMAAGDLLVEAKALLAHGEWTEWLDANCPSVSGRTVRLYMQLARNQEALKRQRIANLTIAEALDLLAPAGSPPNTLRVLENELKAINEGIEISPTHLHLPDDLTHEQWLAVGVIMCALGKGYEQGQHGERP